MSDPITRLNTALEGRYEIEREIGEGGMATVYLARDLRHERQVAVKVLRPELAAVVGAERFLAEIKTTANLQHPHILPLHDSGEADGFLFYVMPYVAGESLRERLDREHQLSVPEAVQIGRTLAQALDYAHREGVVHRDIKPANVLMLDGTPVLSDFGIALAVGAAGGGRLTETGLSLGTPHYMSPEQATGDPHVGPASDIYSLGCVLYEMLAGEPPHRGPTAQAVLANILAGDIEPVTRHRPGVRANVDGAIRQSLQTVPADRFSSAEAFAQALLDAHFRYGESGDAAVPVSRPKRVALLLAFAATWAVGWAFGRAAGSSEPIPLRRSTIELPRQDLLESGGWGIQPLAATSERLVFLVAARFEGLPEGTFAVSRVGELWSRSFADREAVVLEGTRGAHGAFVNPDGQSVAFFHSASRELRRIPITGGPVERIATLDEATFLGGAWTQDDRILYAAPSGIWSIPAAGGPPLRLSEPEGDGTIHRQPHPLPDGDGFAFTITENGTDSVAILRPGSDPRALVEGHSPAFTPDGQLVFARGLERQPQSLWAVRLRSDGSLDGEPLRVQDGLNWGTGQMTAPYTIAGDGTLFYVSDDVQSVIDLDRVDRAGNFSRLVATANPQLPDRTRFLRTPRISPDGSRLAFEAVGPDAPTSRLFVMDLERGVVNSVHPDRHSVGPTWSLDGQRVLFASSDSDGWRILSARADGSGPAETVVGPHPNIVTPYAISPDGRWLVFARRDAGTDDDLWITPLGGVGDARPIVQTPARDFEAALSPDGRWMAYVSEESDGRAEIIVTEFPDSRTRRVVSTGETGSAFSPVWRGSELFMLSERAMLVVDAATNPGLRVGVPRVLFENRVFVCCGPWFPIDVSPDGDWMVWISPGLDGVPKVEMVTAWTEEVSALVDR